MSANRKKQTPPSVIWTITVTLLAVGFISILIQLVIVIIGYGTDEDYLARALTDQETDTIIGATSVSPDGRLKFHLSGHALERYRKYPHSYAFEISDADGNVLAHMNQFMVPIEASLRGLRPDYFMTCLERVPNRVCVSSRRFVVKGQSYWAHVAVAGEMNGYLSNGVLAGMDPAGIVTGVFISEVIDDVGVPMAPVLVALLVVNILAVRRVLRPLGTAAAAVQKLDPRREDMLLPEIDLPREVKVLVHAINDLLVRVNRAMHAQREFTANAAHELRTPLAVLMLRLSELDGAAAERMRADVRNMARLVDQLLEMSRADALIIEPNATVDLTKVARSTVETLAIYALDKGCELEFEDMGAAIVPGNETAIGFALRNLVENAIRHSPRENAVVTVIAGPGPRLQVVDHGPGIPREQHELVFRRFWRGEHQNTGAVGLGLAIVKRVVDAHRASVEIADTPGGGAHVTLLFPPDEAEQSVRSPPHEEPAKRGAREQDAADSTASKLRGPKTAGTSVAG